LNLPPQGSPAGIIDARRLVNLDEPWAPKPGLKFIADSVVSYDLVAWKRDPNGATPSLVWAPGDRQTLSGLGSTHGKLIVNTLDNVRGRMFTLDYVGGRWKRTEIALPRNATVGLVAASDRTDQAM